MLAQLRRHAPRQAKAVLWPFGVDLQCSLRPDSALRPPHSALRLVHAASLLPVKNQALLLDGLALARAPPPAPRSP